jgi:hypothetical protein
VRDREDSDVPRRLDVHNVVRESRYGVTPNKRLNWQPRNACTHARHCHDPIDRGIDSVEEFNPKVLALALVPATGKPVLLVRFFFKSNA